MYLSKKEAAVITSLVDRVLYIEKELKQMKCQHGEVEFSSCFSHYSDWTPKYIWCLSCKNCDKTLNTYETEKEFNSAKATYLRKQADELENKI